MLDTLYNALKHFFRLFGFFRLDTKTTNNAPNLKEFFVEEFDIPNLTFTVPPLQLDLDFPQTMYANLLAAPLLEEPSLTIKLRQSQSNALKNIEQYIKKMPKSPPVTPLPPKVFVNPSAENEEQLNTIPLELWLRIFSYLPVPALLKTIIACKYFGELTNEPAFRMAMAQEKYWIEFFKPYQMNDIGLINQSDEDIYSEPGEKGFILKGKR